MKDINFNGDYPLSENFSRCLELLIELKSLDLDDTSYNRVYAEFASSFSNLTPEEKEFIKKEYAENEKFENEKNDFKDKMYDLELKEKIKNEKINSAHRR